MFSDVCEAHNRLIMWRDQMPPDFFQRTIPTLIEDCSHSSIEPKNGPGFMGYA